MAKKKSSQLEENLWTAIENVEVDKVRKLLEQGADPNHELYWSKEWKSKNHSLKPRPPPLHTAAYFGDLPMVKLLVEHGANVDKGGGRYNMTPLHWAIDGLGNELLVKYFVEEAKCKPNIKDNKKQSPLDKALCQFKDTTAYCLFKLGCGDDSYKAKILSVACQTQNVYLVKEFVQKQSIKESDLEAGLIESVVDCNAIYYREKGYAIAYYLIISCGFGCTEENKAKLLCGACTMSLNTVKKLIEEHRISPHDARDVNGMTPVHLACMKENCKELLIYLVEEQKCSIYTLDKFDQTPFKIALTKQDRTNNYLDQAVYLVHHGFGAEKERVRLLFEGCYWGKLDVVKEMIEKYQISPNHVMEEREFWYRKGCRTENPFTPLVCALDRSDNPTYRTSLDVAMYLVNQGCGSDEDKVRLLFNACKCGKVDAVKELIEQHKLDTKMKCKGRTLMETAVSYGFLGNDEINSGLVDVGLYLLSYDCGTEQERAKLLCLACQSDCGVDVVKELVEKHNINPRDVRDDLQNTPLHYACHHGCRDIVLYLSENQGCNGESRNLNQATPLHMACRKGHKDIVVYLIEKLGCKADVRDVVKVTPLHEACCTGHKDTVVYLVEEQKCSLNSTDANHRTPLDAATHSYHTDVVEYLKSIPNRKRRKLG